MDLLSPLTQLYCSFATSLPCKCVVHFPRVRFQTPAFLSPSLSSVNAHDIHIRTQVTASQVLFLQLHSKATIPTTSYKCRVRYFNTTLTLLKRNKQKNYFPLPTGSRIDFLNVTNFFFPLRKTCLKDLSYPIPALRIIRLCQFLFTESFLNPSFISTHSTLVTVLIILTLTLL